MTVKELRELLADVTAIRRLRMTAGPPERSAEEIRPKVITDLLAVDDTGTVANYIRTCEAELSTLRTRLRAMEEAQGWQPIETYAPSLGEQVWTWDAYRGSNPSMLCDGVWLITYDSAEIQPTHWRALPSPPAPEEGR